MIFTGESFRKLLGRVRFQLQQGAGENTKTGFQRGQSIGFGHELVLGSESVV